MRDTGRASAEAAKLAAFGIDPDRGFLLTPDPPAALPHTYVAWEELAAALPKLLGAGVVRDAIRRLPLLDTSVLSDDGRRRRAMLLLSYFGHAFVWGEDEPADVLPAPVAVPWARVAASLGRPPVLSYASYPLDNWRRLDPHGPIALHNLALLQNFLGGMDEEWFILVHVDIEARAGASLGAAVGALTAAAAADHSALDEALARLADGIGRMHATLGRMPERCDPYIYFHRVRPYIHGWQGHPGLPHGLLYEGVEAFAGCPQRLRGETGAQSSIVPALDALLGIEHEDDVLGQYLREMRGYMPPRHRDFITFLEQRSTVRAAVSEAGSRDLRRRYNECVRGLATFRSRHFEYANRYIDVQSGADRENPSDVGTGGTPFMQYLKKHRDETLTHLLPD